MLQEKSFDTGIGELLILGTKKICSKDDTVNSITKNNKEGNRKRNVTLEKTMKTKKDVDDKLENVNYIQFNQVRKLRQTTR